MTQIVNCTSGLRMPKSVSITSELMKISLSESLKFHMRKRVFDKKNHLRNWVTSSINQHPLKKKEIVGLANAYYLENFV